MAAYNPKWLTLSIALAVATLSASTVYLWRRKSRDSKDARIQELETSLKNSVEKCAAERQGRIKAQQALRKALIQQNSDGYELNSYPMAPIAIIHSCFSTRNGTPRQPLLVPLARACLKFDAARVPPASLEGLEGYSHCWILYVFHLNTDLEKLWKHPSQSKFKAKVRVPRLQGERIGVFATRSPHRPCPIGLTVAKVESVHGQTVLLSGVDLVDGTPVLDVKPYLPYCDSICEATVPEWVKEDNLLAVASISFSRGFSDSLADCWSVVEKRSLYGSQHEFESLIKQVLSWDIRSASQRSRPHNSTTKTGIDGISSKGAKMENHGDDEITGQGDEESSISSDNVIYHLILEGLDVSYRIDCNSNVLVEKNGFVEAHADDGLLESFVLKHGWHASMVMVELISAEHIALVLQVVLAQRNHRLSHTLKASTIRFELSGGEWKEAVMQMDGEPWKQPTNKDCSSFVEIRKVPFQSVMVQGD